MDSWFWLVCLSFGGDWCCWWLVWLVCVVGYVCLVLFRCVVDWRDWFVCFLASVYGLVWYLVVCGLHCLRGWRLFYVDGVLRLFGVWFFIAVCGLLVASCYVVWFVVVGVVGLCDIRLAGFFGLLDGWSYGWWFWVRAGYGWF